MTYNVFTFLDLLTTENPFSPDLWPKTTFDLQASTQSWRRLFNGYQQNDSHFILGEDQPWNHQRKNYNVWRQTLNNGRTTSNNFFASGVNPSHHQQMQYSESGTFKKTYRKNTYGIFDVSLGVDDASVTFPDVTFAVGFGGESQSTKLASVRPDASVCALMPDQHHKDQQSARIMRLNKNAQMKTFRNNIFFDMSSGIFKLRKYQLLRWSLAFFNLPKLNVLRTRRKATTEPKSCIFKEIYTKFYSLSLAVNAQLLSQNVNSWNRSSQSLWGYEIHHSRG